MASATVKIPKKFATICAGIRDGDAEAKALDLPLAYDGLENQKSAVLAEVAYFNGDFEKALALDMKICPFWSEWHYSNIRTEHLSAMAFAARQLDRGEEMISFFEQQSLAAEKEEDLPAHIKNSYRTYYQAKIEYIKTGITEKETYKAPENPADTQTLTEEVIADKKKRKKESDINSNEVRLSLFSKCYNKGSLTDALALYEKIADNNLSTQWHIMALCGYTHMKNTEKAFEILLHMAKQRLWYVAANTQVRPMEFFTHPSIFTFLNDKTALEEITKAASSS